MTFIYIVSWYKSYFDDFLWYLATVIVGGYMQYLVWCRARELISFLLKNLT